MLSFLREQKGSVAVLTALSMTVLLGFAALVVDVGVLYLNRSQLINTADAAALAGVQELPGRAETAVASASSYAVRNGKLGDTVATALANTNTELTVSVSRNVNLFFARIFNYNSQAVSATAVAAVRPMSSVGGAVPFGVVKQEFKYGDIYTLKEGGGDGYSGNYGGLGLGGTGANTYRYNIKYGYDGKLHIGQWVSTEPGNMSGPTDTGVSYRINQDPGATFETVAKDSPRIVMIPVLDSLMVEGRSDVKIVGFAAFFLEGTGGSGQDNYVSGRFMQLVASGEITSSPSADYGLYGATLIK
jgi:Flp pilus assembly protein TadG